MLIASFSVSHVFLENRCSHKMKIVCFRLTPMVYILIALSVMFECCILTVKKDFHVMLINCFITVLLIRCTV